MLKLIKSEIIKIKKSKSNILIFIIPLVMAFLGFINIYNGLVGSDDLWDSVYNQTMLLYAGLTLPLLITISISLQWRLEYHKNNILNLYCCQSRLWCIYISKVLTSILTVFINITILIIFLMFFSKILIPKDSFRAYLIYGPSIAFLYSIPFICLQHLFSMYFKNFFISISAGIILTFLGFILCSTSMGILIPTSYILCGSFIKVPCHNYAYSNYLIALVPILCMFLSFLGAFLFSKKEF